MRVCVRFRLGVVVLLSCLVLLMIGRLVLAAASVDGNALSRDGLLLDVIGKMLSSNKEPADSPLDGWPNGQTSFATLGYVCFDSINRKASLSKLSISPIQVDLYPIHQRARHHLNSQPQPNVDRFQSSSSVGRPMCMYVSARRHTAATRPVNTPGTAATAHPCSCPCQGEVQRFTNPWKNGCCCIAHTDSEMGS